MKLNRISLLIFKILVLISILEMKRNTLKYLFLATINFVVSLEKDIQYKSYNEMEFRY